MKKNLLLTVIIPCFNNGDYVYDCLNSIPNAEQLEVIIVNDGSIDNSEFEINRFIKEHEKSNILLVNQKNQGVSAARNTGVSNASGEYIAFLDADDLWSPIFWEQIKPILLHDRPDMIVFNAVRFYNDDINETTDVNITNLHDGLTKIHDIGDIKGLFHLNEWFPWARVYKKSLFNNIKFPVGRVYEDVAIIPLVTVNSKNIYSISPPLVYYRVRGNSITNKAKEHHIEDIIYAIKMLYNVYERSINKPITLDVIAPSILGLYSLLRRISTRFYGYCYFNKSQRREIKKYITPFTVNCKYGFRMKVKFIGVYCFINKQKNKLIKNLTKPIPPH
ncbi:glycosyltransferase family 2 protein [Providencia rettgeri]